MIIIKPGDWVRLRSKNRTYLVTHVRKLPWIIEVCMISEQPEKGEMLHFIPLDCLPDSEVEKVETGWGICELSQ